MKARTDTKRALLDATKELLKENSSITVKDITDKAFTNVAAVNYHFGDKDELIRLALGEILDKLKSEMYEKFSTQSEGSLSGLDLVMQFLLDFFSEYKGALRYVLLSVDSKSSGGFLDKFFYDEEFVDLILGRISAVSGETDRQKLFYKFTISVSALLMPLVLEGSGGCEGLGLSALMREGSKEPFLETLSLLFKA